MNIGDHVTDLEGHDLGDKGAVIVSMDGDTMTLSILDSTKQVTVKLPEVEQVAIDVDYEGTGVEPGVIDEDAMGGPSVNNIRSLPLWWGPRDPNNPSSLTQVMWEPEPRWRRMQQRVWAHAGARYKELETSMSRYRAADDRRFRDVSLHHEDDPEYGAAMEELRLLREQEQEPRRREPKSPEEAEEIIFGVDRPRGRRGVEETEEEIEESPLRRDMWNPTVRRVERREDPGQRDLRKLTEPRGYGRGAAARRADYDPTLTLPEPDSGRLLGIGFNLPRRMRVDLWEERDADTLGTAELMRLTDEFWRGYRKKRWSYMSERGDRMNLPLDRYVQVFRRDLDLATAEVQGLIDFMYVTRLLPETEARMVADNYQLGYTYAWDRLDY